jgi:hypothetical protein
MSRNALRALGAAAVLAFAGGLYLLLDGAGEDRRPGSADKGVPTIVVRDGEPVGGVRELTFYSDEAIRFRVTSDSAQEVHLHGYDVAKEVEPGGTVAFDVPADIAGIFGAELEDTEEQIARVTVRP